MQLQIAAKPSVLCCHLANTNKEWGGLATEIPPFAKLLWSLRLIIVYRGCLLQLQPVSAGGSSAGRHTVRVLQSLLDHHAVYVTPLPRDSLHDTLSSQRTPIRFASLFSVFRLQAVFAYNKEDNFVHSFVVCFVTWWAHYPKRCPGNLVGWAEMTVRHQIELTGWVNDWLDNIISNAHLSNYISGQLSLAVPPWVGAMSTSESWDVDRHTARCTSPVSTVLDNRTNPIEFQGQRLRAQDRIFGFLTLAR